MLDSAPVSRDRFNVGSFLPRSAASRPEADAIVAANGRGGWRRITFAELDRRTDSIARGLTEYGIGRGVRTLVMVRAGIDLISITYALFKAGAVPVLIDPGMGRRAFLRCVADTQPEAFVGIPLAHVARLLFPGPFRTVTRRVTVGRRLFWGGASLDDWTSRTDAWAPAPTTDGEAAAVLFTSGSTGPAKGAVYSHGNFRAQVDALSASYGFAPGEVDLAAFPLFSLFDCAFEMTSVIPEIDPSRPGSCDPAQIVRALVDNRCTTAFGSPAVWRRVAPWCRERGVRIPALKRVLMAGAPVPSEELRALTEVLEADAMAFTPYGCTEALPIAKISARTVLDETRARTREGAGTCVGVPDASIDLAVIRIDDGPLVRWDDGLRVPKGAVGELCVRGPVVTRRYQNRPDADRVAKVRDGDHVWHRVGDLGYVDDDGRLWFAGRKAERVETERGTLYTDLVEGRYVGRPGIARCALVGVGPTGTQRPLLIVEGQADAALARAIVDEGIVEDVLFHPRFPTDVRHNAKIHRHALARWAERRLGK